MNPSDSSPAPITLAFLGLGAMGYPMARWLAQSSQENGHTLLVWNRHRERAEAHTAETGSRVAELGDLANADLIVTCLPTSAEVDEVMARLPNLRPGAVWLDCTSGHPDAARRQVEELRSRGVTFLDAPVSGGVVGAEAGKLTVMVGGDAAALERVRALLSFAGQVTHVGPSGAGFAVKAINNALLAVTLWATGEGLAALAGSGVDLGAALSVINASSGRSNASQNLIPQRVLTRQFPPTFKLGLLAKDADIAMDVVHAVKGSTPLLAQVAALVRGAAQLIGPDEDHTAALKLIEQMNGVELR
ncbi:NAD(P)-dependent oxidoreductase [Deinococcus sp.]|uniref:NAD(P)-dependent oxidoreductase n=1 Tax=Deinococcus sp. TaxID=47478 RepID=UPI0025F61217|nr:NAD(P)-dependent oxidoreductase [Deinococcus sp.]